MRKIITGFFLCLLIISCISFVSFGVSSDCALGCSVTEMLHTNGSTVTDGDTVYYTDEKYDNFIFSFNDGEAELICQKSAKCLNIIDNKLYFVCSEGDFSTILCLDVEKNSLTQIKSKLPSDMAYMYVTAEGKAYYMAESTVFSVNLSSGDERRILQKENLLSFVPFGNGLIYATGEMFNFSLFADDVRICDGADSYSVDTKNSLITFTKQGKDFQLSIDSAFVGDVEAQEYTGLGTVDADELFSDMVPDESVTDSCNESSVMLMSESKAVKNRKELSPGIKNIIKRTEQMNKINWTAQKDIFGWEKGYTYKAGQTYTGLPYGQPVYAKYVPWVASFAEFLQAVDNPDSLMYTKYSYNAEIAPYYSVDCSAYVSWAWQLSERHTTVGIPNKATLVSKTSYADAKVGDAICKSGTHVVIISDITYDENGIINSITITEASPKKDTDFCCQTTSYGAGFELSLADFNKKYFYDNYRLYRNPKASEVTYTHYCEVILDSDKCSVCNVGVPEVTKPFDASVRVNSDTILSYLRATDRSEILSSYRKGTVLSVSCFGKDSQGKVWYQLKNGGWIPGDGLDFVKLNSTAVIADMLLPSGEIAFAEDPSIEGNVTCNNLIYNIKAEVFSASDMYTVPVISEQTGKVADAFRLKGSKLDTLVSFDVLTSGRYLLCLTVTEYSYSPITKQTVFADKVYKSTFNVLDDPRCTSWSTEYPQLVDPQFVEQERRYCYSDLITVVSDKAELKGYSLVSSKWIAGDSGTATGITVWPEGFSRSNYLYSKYDLSDIKAVKTENRVTAVSTGATVGYVYYHWCENSLTSGPADKLINSTQNSAYKAFHAFYSTTTPDTLKKAGNCYQYSNASCCTTSYWYYAIPVVKVSYKTIEKEYTHSRWSAWSAWSDTVYEKTDTRAVKTAIVYRYNDKMHTWDEGVIELEPTCSSNGLSVHNCSECDMVKNQPLPMKEHSFSDEYTIDSPAGLTSDGSESRHCTECTATADSKPVNAVASFKLSFESVDYNGKKQTPYLSVYDKQGKRLTYKTDYTVKYPKDSVNVGTYTLTVNFKGRYSGQKELTYTIKPLKPISLTALQTENSITLSWRKAYHATCYRVYLYDSTTKTYKALKTTYDNSYTHENLVSCKQYTYAVRAYTKTDSGYLYSGITVFTTATKPVAPELKAVSAEKGKISLSWTKSAGVTGYQIYLYNKQTGKYQKLTNSTQRFYTVSSLEEKSTQYIRVRAYRKVGTSYVYGDFSNLVKVQVK